jgi:hypothetical protein
MWLLCEPLLTAWPLVLAGSRLHLPSIVAPPRLTHSWASGLWKSLNVDPTLVFWVAIKRASPAIPGPRPPLTACRVGAVGSGQQEWREMKHR